MKKLLIASAALAMVAGTAQAQSSVTVYGLIDAGYATSNIDHGAAKETNQKAVGGLHSANGTGTLSGSRLGFRGTEDVGGGTKINFVLETGINYSNGQAATTTASSKDAALANTNMFANVRQGWAGISGGFGDVRIGTHNSIAKDAGESIDPNAGVTLTGYFYQAGLAVTRPANSVTYLSPRMSGFQFQAQADEGESTTSTTSPKDNSGTSFALDYTQGKLKAVAWTETRKKQNYLGTSGNRLISLELGSVTLPIAAGAADTTTFSSDVPTTTAGTPNTIDKVTQDGIGGSYDFGITKVALMTTKLKFKDATATDNGEIKTNLLGVQAPFGSNVLVRASVSTGKIKSELASEGYDLDGYQLVAMYNLSKRSHLYAAIGQTKYDSPTADKDVKINQMGVGLRTTF